VIIYLTQASGAQLGTMFQNLANIGTGIIIGFVYGWQLTLVILAFIPIIGIAGVLQMKLLEGVSGMLYNKQISFLRLQLNYKSWKSIY
jgi:uncharacterized membrane protein (Fun14 family)